MVQVADRLGQRGPSWRRRAPSRWSRSCPLRPSEKRRHGESGRLTHVDGQLLDLGGQEPGLGPDQLHQQPCRVGVEHRVLVRGMMNQPGNHILSGGLLQSQGKPDVATCRARLVFAGQDLTIRTSTPAPVVHST